MPAYALGVAGVLGLAVYFLAPRGVQNYTYDAYGLTCALALGFRSWRSQPDRSAPWTLATAGVGLWVVGDVLSSIRPSFTGEAAPLLTDGDLLYVLGYPVLVLSIMRFIRLRRPERDRGLRLEGLMLLCAAALPLYEYWVRPALESTHTGTAQATVTLLYPLLDLALIAAGVRAALGVTGWRGSGVLLGAALLANVVADAIYNVQILNGTYSWPGPVDTLWLLAYLSAAVAALHPSAARLTDRRPKPPRGMFRQRTVFVGLVLLSPLTVVAAAFVRGDELHERPVLAAAAGIGLLLALRIRSLTREGAGRWRAHALLFGAGFVVLLMAIAMSHARSISQARLADAGALTRAEVHLGHLTSIEADARSGEHPIPQARRDFRAASRSLERELKLTGWNGAERLGESVLQDLATYEAVVAHELQLFAAGRRDAAERLDDLRVEPAHRRLADALRRAIDAFRASAAARARNERAGMVLLFALGAAVLMLLLRLLGATRRAGALAEERLQATTESERRFRALVAGSGDMITLIDADTRVLAYPETVEGLLGCEHGTMLGRRIDEFLRDADALRTAEVLRKLAERPGETASVDWIVCPANGARVTAEARIRNHVFDPHLQGYVLNVRDVTERRDLEHELEHRALHDGVTGLPNRALLEDRLRHALVRSARRPSLHAVLMIDLDDFKSVNDSLGHDAGDELLVQIGRRLGGSLRSEDTLARFGGDEFAVLVEDVPGVDDALETAQRLIETLRDPVTVAGRQVTVGASVGVSVSDASATGTVEELAKRELSNADLAMYQAKRAGGGGVELFAPEMHAAVTRRVQLRAEIQRGLERGEFVPFFQPIVEMSSRRVVGFEALARWQHPDRGLVPPGDFIPVAEQSGLIVELGNSILRQATSELATWGDPRLYVSVNVAGPQLQRDAILDEVASAIRDAGIAPGRLLLEVTESALIHDSAGNERRLAQLRDLGLRLAIDDFGTGYSSLSYLQRFSMDVLKIDKSFIDPMSVGRRTPLVEAMITMARALGLQVIAEGIETPAQMFALIERGCATGQGYLFSKPMAGSDVEPFLADKARVATPV